MMNWKTLDFIFPFIIFGYGGFTTLVFHTLGESPARVRFPLPESYLQQLERHRPLSALCLILGAVWSLQNLWFQGVFAL
jgi:hypothetical protein